MKTEKEITYNFTVDRKTWYRGKAEKARTPLAYAWKAWTLDVV